MLSERPNHEQVKSRYNTVDQAYQRTEQYSDKCSNVVKVPTNNFVAASHDERVPFQSNNKSKSDRKNSEEKRKNEKFDAKDNIRGSYSCSRILYQDKDRNKSYDSSSKYECLSRRSLHSAWDENECGSHNEGWNNRELSSGRKHSADSDSSFRSYANIEHYIIEETLSPKASVQTQTTKSYTRDISMGHRYVRGSVNDRQQNFERYEDNKILSSTRSEQGIVTSYAERRQMNSKDKEFLPPLKLSHGRMNISVNDHKPMSLQSREMNGNCNHREAHLKSPNMTKDSNQIDTQLNSPLRFQVKTNRGSYDNAIFVSPTRCQKTCESGSQIFSPPAYRKVNISGSVNSEFIPLGQCQKKQNGVTSEYDSITESNIMSPTQYERKSERDLFSTNTKYSVKDKVYRNNMAVPVQQLRTENIKMSFCESPNKYHVCNHNEKQFDTSTEECKKLNKEKSRYPESLSKYMVSDSQHKLREDLMTSPLNKRNISSCNTDLLKSPIYSNNSGGYENQKESHMKSPSSSQEIRLKSQLISPIQDRFRTKHKRSEILTAENLDLLNQSFNDSFMNVSVNQSSLNASLGNEKHEKVTQWLCHLESDEESPNKISLSAKVSVRKPEIRMQVKDKSGSPANGLHGEGKIDSEINSHVLDGNNKRNTNHQFTDSVCFFDQKLSRPPSRRFKTFSKESVDTHKPSTGYIAKGTTPCFPHKFKGMSNKELMRILTSDTSEISNLVSLKSKSGNLSDLQQTKDDISDFRAGQQFLVTQKELTESMKKSVSRIQQTNTDTPSPYCCLSGDDRRKLSPKLPVRDKTPRQTPYSALTRSDYQTLSPSLSKQEHKDRNGVKSKHREITSTTENFSSYEMENKKQNFVRQSAKYTDTDSINEYCEEGGQERCCCDDIENKHMDLYDSFSSVETSNFRSPHLQSRYEFQSKNFENNNQASPCTSMSKLKLNTPRSRRYHQERSPLADRGLSRHTEQETHQHQQEAYSEQVLNKYDRVVTAHDKNTHYGRFCTDLRCTEDKIGTVSSEIIGTVQKLGMTYKNHESEKENFQDVSFGSNHCKIKSKKSLLTVSSKTGTDNYMVARESNRDVSNFETDNCFKVPMSSPVIEKQNSSTVIRNDRFINRQVSGHNQRGNHLNNVAERSKMEKVKNTETRNVRPVSKRNASVGISKQSISRPERRFVNQFDYVHSTPIHPGVKFSLNETLSTIVGSEDTEQEDDDVMLIDE